MVSIDPSTYMRQPKEWRARMDEWLITHQLPKNSVYEVTEVEAGYMVSAYRRDQDGKFIVADGGDFPEHETLLIEDPDHTVPALIR